MLRPGEIVADYRIEGVLGQGKMGVVYRATELSTDRPVALKLLAAPFGDDPHMVARFEREGRLQAALQHQHIVSIYGAGHSDHGLYLAMRLIEGATLKDLIRADGLDPARAVGILAQVAGALDDAHTAGLIHRDVKPQNVLVAAEDWAYLCDFGLGRGSDEIALTVAGQFLGSVYYASPEQIRGVPLTSAADLYALCAVLYECLTGQVPYPRSTDAAALFAHIREPPPRVTELRLDLPVELDAVMAAGMAKDPDQRPASATELIDAARRALDGAG
jgi:serine/threonine-protein kinase